MEFCEQSARAIQKELNTIYSNRDVLEHDSTAKQRALIPAKTALSTIIRAIKRRDYMQFIADDITEVAAISPVLPGIL